MEFSKLLEPGKIGSMELKNRIVMAPMGNRLCGLWGEVNDAALEWYATRARGGAGLITTEACHVATAIIPRTHSRMLRADDDSYSPGLYILAEAVHEAGAKISMQLAVGGTQLPTGSSWMPGSQRVEQIPTSAPSAVVAPGMQTLPREMTAEEIKKTVEMFGWAAERVKRIGFDCVEVHAHYHALLGYFMSPYFNRRTDEYGGSLDGRIRFLLEVVDSIRKKVGPVFPLVVKYSIDEFLDGGRGIDDGLVIAQRLEQAGVDAINISRGIPGSKQPPTVPMYWPTGYMVPLAAAVKKVVKIPVIVAGRLGDPVLAERVLEEGKADFIGMGRPLIADPDLPRKVAEGRIKEIRRCIVDNECYDFSSLACMRCTVNAVAGRELKYGEIKPAEKVKMVFVAGAGPAGMEAARVAGLRGHRVILCEKTGELGGTTLRSASAPPHKEVFRNITDYYSAAFEKLENVTIKLGEEATADAILEEKPDTVIIATGGTAFVPDIPGVGGDNVVTAGDVLGGRAKVGQRKTIVIVGGASVGCETANYLAKRMNRVIIVEMLDTIGADIQSHSLVALRDELSQGNVTIMTRTRVEAITEHGVVIVDEESHKTALQADMVVLAVGVRPVNELAKAMAGRVKELYTIGDAKEPRRIRDAISEGFIVAYDI